MYDVPRMRIAADFINNADFFTNRPLQYGQIEDFCTKNHAGTLLHFGGINAKIVKTTSISTDNLIRKNNDHFILEVIKRMAVCLRNWEP